MSLGFWTASTMAFFVISWKTTLLMLTGGLLSLCRGLPAGARRLPPLHGRGLLPAVAIRRFSAHALWRRYVSCFRGGPHTSARNPFRYQLSPACWGVPGHGRMMPAPCSQGRETFLWFLPWQAIRRLPDFAPCGYPL